MKKVLFSTTALAAAGALAFGAQDAQAQSKAKKMSIGLGGFMKQFVAFSEQDGSFESTTNSTARVGYDSFNITSDSEVYFRGTTKMDNGIGVSVVIQLEGDAHQGTSIDESYVKLTGGFGDIRIGATKHAAFVLKHRAPVVGAHPLDSPDSNSYIIRPASQALGAAVATHIGGRDDVKVVYISPKFADAIRVGASYTPSQTAGNNAAAVGGNAGTETQVYDAMVSYESKLGATSVKADVGYHENHGTANNSLKAWRGGINLGFGGVTVGLGYKDQSDIDTGKGGTNNSDEETVYDVGVSFKAGGWTLGATYLHGERPLASGTQGDDEVDKFSLGGKYALGPGVTLMSQFMWVDWDNESTADADNNDGWALIAGVGVSF